MNFIPNVVKKKMLWKHDKFTVLLIYFDLNHCKTMSLQNSFEPMTMHCMTCITYSRLLQRYQPYFKNSFLLSQNDIN